MIDPTDPRQGPLLPGDDLTDLARAEPAREGECLAEGEKSVALVFCERVDNQNVCDSILRELEEHLDVRVFGPGWESERWEDLDLPLDRLAFYLELDAVTGAFHRPCGLDRLRCPKFAWVIDTHKKPQFHRAIARDVDLTFYAMKCWEGAFDRPAEWLPVHFDQRLFSPRDRERTFDLAFVGSHDWRADPLRRIAERHGLKLHVSCTTGAEEKSETARIYSKSKLVFNKHVANDLNFRVVEAMGCGRVLLSDAQPNGQEELFEDRKHYVLYQDEQDLERLVLHYLQDDQARAEIEEAAAAHAHAKHSTRARVEELLARIEAWRARQAPSRAPEREPAPLRWLVCAGEAPDTVEELSYAEALARELCDGGQHVVVARRSRHGLPRPVQSGSGPVTIDLDAGPLPSPTQSKWLMETGPHLMRLDRIVADHGPFDVVLAEGHEGGLVGASFAERLGLPLVVALGSVEVRKRANRMTRTQLYFAELEHWACARASAVLTPDPETRVAAREFYGVEALTCPWPDARLAPLESADVEEFLREIGLDRYVLALDGDGLSGEPTVVLGESVRLYEEHEDPRELSPDSASGLALAALLQGARRVEGRDRFDRRLQEAARLRGSTPVKLSMSALDVMRELQRRLEPLRAKREVARALR